MELAPYNPSFLDMRNAILVADTAVFDGAHHDAIWQVFAKRGMGFSAGSDGGGDTDPTAAFDLPPATITTGDIQGTVTDADSGDPVAGVTVSLKFQGAGRTNPAAVTAADGTYEIDDVPAIQYPELVLSGHGYQDAEGPVTVPDGDTTTEDFHPRYNWAGPGSGAEATANGADYSSIGCGPDAAIDGSESNGWSTSAGPGKSTDGSQGFGQKHLTIRLDEPVDIAEIDVDPSSTCGDDATSSTAGYQIETSASASGPWALAHTDTFTEADNGKMNQIPITTANTDVQYVKFTITSDQVPDFATDCADGGGPSGCHYVDLSELQVFGVASSS
jgi:hypothetical protein